MTSKSIPFAGMYGGWKDDVLNGKPPVLYDVGTGFENVKLGPGRVVAIGAPPGYGKTSLVGQIVFNAMYIQSELRAVFCNVEMTPDALMERELARTSGVSLSKITSRDYRADKAAHDRIRAGFDCIEGLEGRLAFVASPFALDNVAATVEEHGGDIIILDYIQRIPVYSDPKKNPQDTRQQITEAMTMIRQIANAGHAVIVVSAVARDKKSNGKAYDNPTLGSFRESSEVEYGADDCYLLQREAAAADTFTLRHPKSRRSMTQDIMLRFDGKLQRWQRIGGEDET